jgi:Fur family transcriptional regulator, ferric uptake regulator
MTTFRSAEPIQVGSVAAAIAAVRTRGLRVSTSRRLVLEALFAADKPVSAEYIATGLDGRLLPLDLGSVYRNLETLERLGVVRHFHAGHGPGLYTIAGRDAGEYLVCDTCGRVQPLERRTLDPVRLLLRDELGWRARFAHFPIVATCPACAATLGE